MSSGAAARTTFVILVMVACADRCACPDRFPGARRTTPVAMTPSGIVRVRGGLSLVVLVEKNGSRRLPCP